MSFLSPIATVREILLADVALSAAVAARVYLMAAPQGSLTPRLVVRAVSGARDSGLGVVEGQAKHRVSVDCQSVTVGEANALGAQAYATLNNRRRAGIDVIIFANEIFLVDDATKLARRILDFYVYPSSVE